MDKQEHIHLPAAITCRFVQVMKNREYHEGTPYEAMFGQPMKVGLKTSNLPDEAIDDIRTEEELKEIIDSIQQGNLPMKLLKMPKDLVEAGTMYQET